MARANRESCRRAESNTITVHKTECVCVYQISSHGMETSHYIILNSTCIENGVQRARSKQIYDESYIFHAHFKNMRNLTQKVWNIFDVMSTFNFFGKFAKFVFLVICEIILMHLVRRTLPNVFSGCPAAKN